MPHYPTITIVVPTFNSAASLGATLDSCRAQDYPGLDVQLVDGGSTDGTVAIATSFEGIALNCVSEQDRGIYDACNKGIARAKGDLILVLGSDDRLAPKALHAVAQAWLTRKTDIVAGRALLESASGGQLRVDEPYGLGVLVSGIPFCHNAMFVTQQAYAKVGAYDQKYRICADAHWVHRAVRAACTAQQLDDLVVYFAETGLSSRDSQGIMDETYAVVMESFPFLNLEDAQTVFKVVRGWIGIDALPSVLTRYSDRPDFMAAVTAALGARMPAQAGVPVKPSSFWRRLATALAVR
jgi:glycosyltransferase involved in cell wall biosynthesis